MFPVQKEYWEFTDPRLCLTCDPDTEKIIFKNCVKEIFIYPHMFNVTM